MRIKGHLNSERGSSSVEFALVLPLFFLVGFAIIEYGWYFTQQIMLADAVSAGARAAVKAREWNDESPEDFAVETVKQAFWLSDFQNGQVRATLYTRDTYGPKRIEVTVADFPYRPLTGYLPKTLLPKFLAAKSVMMFP